MTQRIHITHSMIRRGLRGSATHCPVSFGLKAVGLCYDVGDSLFLQAFHDKRGVAGIKRPKRLHLVDKRIPSWVNGIIKGYDESGIMLPFSFRVEVKR